MKGFIVIGLVAVVAGVALVAASGDAKDELIALDKKWGVAGTTADKATLETIYADDVLVVDGSGVTGKAEAVAAAGNDDPDAKYEPTDFKVNMISEGVAVMTHAVEGSTSLHVWAKRDGNWVVVATAAVSTSDSSSTDR
jgi:ketosteroid isomerase-like protein